MGESLRQWIKRWSSHSPSFKHTNTTPKKAWGTLEKLKYPLLHHDISQFKKSSSLSEFVETMPIAKTKTRSNYPTVPKLNHGLDETTVDAMLNDYMKRINENPKMSPSVDPKVSKLFEQPLFKESFDPNSVIKRDGKMSKFGIPNQVQGVPENPFRVKVGGTEATGIRYLE